MDIEQILGVYVRIVVQILPLCVVVLAGRRMVLSRSINGVYYAFACGFAFVAAIGTSPALFEGRALEPVAVIMALMAVPIWALVREITHKEGNETYTLPVRPTFATSRERDIRAPLVLAPEMCTEPGHLIDQATPAH